MTTFSIPGNAIQRLSRLALAADTTAPGPISHIALRVTASAARFTATNGRLLASLLLPITDLSGEPSDCILDRGQYTAAWKLLGKSTTRSVLFSIEKGETRVSIGSVSAVIRCHDATYPAIDHIWTRTAGKQWVPTAASLDPDLAATAQRIAGSSRILFNSPVSPESGLHRLWSAMDVGAFPEQDAIPSLSSLQVLLRAPAYFCDNDLALLVMPVTRAAEERQLDLSAFACLPAPATAIAA